MKGLNPIEFVAGLRGVISGRKNIPESLKDNPVLQVLLSRRSCRSFRNEDIPDDVFAVILEAARVAPSAVNLQSWSFGVFDRHSWKERFGSVIPFNGNRAIIVLGDVCRVRQALDEFPFRPLVEYTLCVTNASIAAYAMNIAAESCGVSSVMLSETAKSGFFDAQFIKAKLGLPAGVFPIMTIVFGYAQRKALGMPPKLPMEEIVFENSYKLPDRKIMKDWLQQMMAAYRCVYVTRSFSQQLKQYLSKIDAAEQGLKDLIFHRPEDSS